MGNSAIKKSNKNLIIAGKPLQLLTAISTAEQIKIIDDCDIFLVDNFFASKKFVKNYNNLNHKWPELTHYKTFDQACQRFIDGEYSCLLIDSDIGAKKYLRILRKKIKNKKIKMYVYEEGQGTYRDNIRVGIKKYIFSLLGIGHVFGGCMFTSKIFLYNSDKYSKKFPTLAKKAVQIDKPIISFIGENLTFLNELFRIDLYLNKTRVSNDIAYLILMEKNTSIESVKAIKYFRGDKFLKRHPHIKTFSCEDGFNSIDNSIPAELIILNLSNIYTNLIIFHFGTSARRYINKSNISYFQLTEEREK
jgi:hypothetical protein